MLRNGAPRAATVKCESEKAVVLFIERTCMDRLVAMGDVREQMLQDGREKGYEV